MFDAHFSPDAAPCDDYAAQVAAEVAARYAVLVPAAVVQVVPLGQSGLPALVWENGRLIYPDHKGKALGQAYKAIGSAKARAARRGGLVDPEVSLRREHVVALHRKGMTDAQIAQALGVLPGTVQADRRFLQIRANVAPSLGPRTVTQVRMARVKVLAAQGASRAAMMEDMGISRDVLTSVAKLAGVALPRLNAAPRPEGAPRVRRAPKAVGGHAAIQGRAARMARVADLVGEGLNRAEIRAALQISDDTLCSYIHELGLPLPPTGKVRADSSRALRMADLRAMDVSQFTVPQLAARFGCSDNAMRADLREMGLRARACGVPMSAEKMDELAARRRVVADLVAKGKSRAQILDALGVACSTLQNDLKHLDLKIQRAPVVKKIFGKGPSREEIAALRDQIRACRARRMSLAEIVAETGRAQGTVSYHLKVMGLDGQGRRAGQTVAREKAVA